MPSLTNNSPFITQSKEDFSFAYLRAIVAASDCYVEKRDRDVRGIDGTIFQYNCNGRFPMRGLDFQLKCSHVPKLLNDAFTYDLAVKNYDRLREAGSTDPAILIVVVVPEAVEDWALHSEQRLEVYRCAYWVDLRGYPLVSNKNTRAIKIARDSQLDIAGLVALMDQVTDDRF